MIQAIQKKAATTEVMTAHFLSAEGSPTKNAIVYRLKNPIA
jgi:hypothetical protein